MTVLFTDASPQRKDSMDVHHPASVIKEVIYADDTLLVAVKLEDAESFMHDVVVAGKVYGLSLNWDKTEVMPVGGEAIKGPDGKHIGSRQAITYLGGVIAANGSINSELNRRLGMAKGDFDALNRVWKHANLGLKKKLDIFSACVISRLLYSLHTAWLRKAELRKIDAFQAKCLRKILGIQHAFYSHVRNETVLQEADRSKLSTIIRRQQLLLLGRVAQLPPGDVMRTCIFHGGTFEPRMPNGRRQRGRPRQIWLAEVYQLALDMCGDRQSLEYFWNQPSKVWREKVFTHNF